MSIDREQTTDLQVGTKRHTLLSYSDQVSWGIPIPVLAQKIQSDLVAAGIMPEPDGLPNVTALPLYRNAKNHIGALPYAYRSNVEGDACHSVWAIEFHPMQKTA